MPSSPPEEARRAASHKPSGQQRELSFGEAMDLNLAETAPTTAPDASQEAREQRLRALAAEAAAEEAQEAKSGTMSVRLEPAKSAEAPAAPASEKIVEPAPEKSEIKPAVPAEKVLAEQPSVIVDEKQVPGVERFASRQEFERREAERRPPPAVPEKPAAKVETKAPVQSEAETKMLAASQQVAELEAQLKKFEGLGAARLLSGSNRAERARLTAELEKVRQEYRENRAEVVAGNVEKMLAERERQVEERAAAAVEKKPFLKKLVGKAYDSYKKLGELNLTKLGWKPTSRVGRLVSRVLSARMAISLGLLGGGLLLGAGTAVGAGAIQTRRLFAGGASAFGSYDLMKMFADKSGGRFKPDELHQMPLTEVIGRMEKIESRAMLDGAALAGNESYATLRRRFGELAKGSRQELTDLDVLNPEQAGAIDRLMEQADARLEAARLKTRSSDRKMKVAASAMGVLVGSGAFAKVTGGLWRAMFGSGEPMVATFKGAPPEAGLGLDETQPPEVAKVTPEGDVLLEQRGAGGLLENEKIRELAEVHRGDGYTQIFKRQLLANPESYGYKPEMGSPDHWALNKSIEIARDQGLMSGNGEMRLDFDPNKPAYAALEKLGDGHIGLSKLDVADHVYRYPKVADFAKEGWRAGVQYNSNGLPTHVNLETLDANKLPGVGDVRSYLLEHNEAMRGLDASRGLDSLLGNEQYAKWFGRLYREQQTLDWLAAKGYGASQAAEELQASLAKKFGYLESLTAEEPVKFELPPDLDTTTEAGDLIQFKTVDAYEQVFETRGVTRESLETLVRDTSGSGEIDLVDKNGVHFRVEADDIYAKAAASRELNELREAFAHHAGGQFKYDAATGALKDFQPKVMGDYSQVLKPGWEKAVADLAAQSKVYNAAGLEMRVGELGSKAAAYEAAFEKLAQVGRAATPEGRFLARLVTEQHEALDQLLGKSGVVNQVPVAAEMAAAGLKVTLKGQALESLREFQAVVKDITRESIADSVPPDVFEPPAEIKTPPLGPVVEIHPKNLGVTEEAAREIPQEQPTVKPPAEVIEKKPTEPTHADEPPPEDVKPVSKSGIVKEAVKESLIPEPLRGGLTLEDGTVIKFIEEPGGKFVLDLKFGQGADVAIGAKNLLQPDWRDVPSIANDSDAQRALGNLAKKAFYVDQAINKIEQSGLGDSQIAQDMCDTSVLIKKTMIEVAHDSEKILKSLLPSGLEVPPELKSGVGLTDGTIARMITQPSGGQYLEFKFQAGADPAIGAKNLLQPDWRANEFLAKDEAAQHFVEDQARHMHYLRQLADQLRGDDSKVQILEKVEGELMRAQNQIQERAGGLLEASIFKR